MSAPFVAQDRAYCMDDSSGATGLVMGQLYCVERPYMDSRGNQTLSLVGLPGNRYVACRFVRIPDPAARRWPKSCEGYE